MEVSLVIGFGTLLLVPSVMDSILLPAAMQVSQLASQLHTSHRPAVEKGCMLEIMNDVVQEVSVVAPSSPPAA